MKVDSCFGIKIATKNNENRYGHFYIVFVTSLLIVYRVYVVCSLFTLPLKTAAAHFLALLLIFSVCVTIYIVSRSTYMSSCMFACCGFMFSALNPRWLRSLIATLPGDLFQFCLCFHSIPFCIMRIVFGIVK